jgi:hypothetical protein
MCGFEGAACEVVFVRTRGAFALGGGFGLAVEVNAGLLLSALLVCLGWLISLSLLATARGVVIKKSANVKRAKT